MTKIAAIVRLPAAPGKRDELVKALQIALDNVENETGTLRYILHTDNADADACWFYELYTDAAALDAHSGSEWFKTQLVPALGGLVGGAPETHRLTPVGGKGV